MSMISKEGMFFFDIALNPEISSGEVGIFNVYLCFDS